MAGYIMTLNSEDSLNECVERGIYSTLLNPPKNYWSMAAEGTFADYSSMKAGDSIFFFIHRKIYGIGELIDIDGDCKYLNYHHADDSRPFSENEYKKNKPLMTNGNANNRCICFFIPKPFYFKKSVDMDDALASNPSKFRMLRAMWGLSFIKIDDEETQALIDIILKRNEACIFTKKDIYTFDNKIHVQIEEKIDDGHKLYTSHLLTKSANDAAVKHEMALEAYLCSVLGRDNDSPFGKWDYVSHQVIASPFKPIDYMDKMDIFGYRYIEGYKTISKYLVMELKKDIADIAVIDQIMKYVDWVKQEYAHGDYSMIEAYVVAFDYPQEVIEKCKKECIRNYMYGYRPSEAKAWSSVKLVKYRVYDDDVEFIEIQ